MSGLLCLLILAGVTPLIYLEGREYLYPSEALSVPVSLKPGEFLSPIFTTDLGDDHQIEIYFVPPDRIPLDIDWKVVDEAGGLMDSGTYSEERLTGANDAILERHYRPKRRARQRVILRISRDVQQTSESDIRLHVGVPERSLEQAHGSAAALVWLFLLAGPGAGLLIVLAILRMLRPRRPSG